MACSAAIKMMLAWSFPAVTPRRRISGIPPGNHRRHRHKAEKPCHHAGILLLISLRPCRSEVGPLLPASHRGQGKTSQTCYMRNFPASQLPDRSPAALSRSQRKVWHGQWPGDSPSGPLRPPPSSFLHQRTRQQPDAMTTEDGMRQIPMRSLSPARDMPWHHSGRASFP